MGTLARGAAAFGLCCSLLLLGGCGGVEFKGKIFQWVGLAGDQQRQQQDVKMASQPPLVVPPNTKYLPPPGSGPQAPANPQWPTNPETLRREAAKKKQAEKAKEAEASEPWNPYAGKPTLLDKLLHRNAAADAPPMDSVPAPDPSDSIPPLNGQTQQAQVSGYKPPTTDGLEPPPPHQESHGPVGPPASARGHIPGSPFNGM